MVGIAALAAGCSLGGTSHSTLTLSQAEQRARDDGFVKVVNSPGLTWHCSGHEMHLGDQPGDTTSGTRPSYRLDFGDRRAPAAADGSARVAMTVVLFPSAGFAARCAAGGLYAGQHEFFVDKATGKQTVQPSRRISADTIAIYVHRANTPGSLPGHTGEYDTWLASGRVLAFGLAYNRADSQIVQQDLARLAAQISG